MTDTPIDTRIGSEKPSLPEYTTEFVETSNRTVLMGESSRAGKTLLPTYITIFYYLLAFIIFIMY